MKTPLKLKIIEKSFKTMKRRLMKDRQNSKRFMKKKSTVELKRKISNNSKNNFKDKKVKFLFLHLTHTTLFKENSLFASIL